MVCQVVQAGLPSRAARRERLKTKMRRLSGRHEGSAGRR